MLQRPFISNTTIIIIPNYRRNSLARRNYIASNLQNSHVEVCICALRNTPVDLAKVYYLDSFAIVLMFKTQSCPSE